MNIWKVKTYIYVFFFKIVHNMRKVKLKSKLNLELIECAILGAYACRVASGLEKCDCYYRHAQDVLATDSLTPGTHAQRGPVSPFTGATSTQREVGGVDQPLAARRRDSTARRRLAGRDATTVGCHKWRDDIVRAHCGCQERYLICPFSHLHTSTLLHPCDLSHNVSRNVRRFVFIISIIIDDFVLLFTNAWQRILERKSTLKMYGRRGNCKGCRWRFIMAQTEILEPKL